MANVEDIRLSIVVATTGRPSLERTLQSIAAQAGLTRKKKRDARPGWYKWEEDKCDECIVVGTGFLDRKPPSPEEIHIVMHLLPAPGGDWGNYEHAIGVTRATGTHIMYCDDDDALLPGAIAMVKRALARAPGRPHMFRMIDLNGAILWSAPRLEMGNVGTPMFVFPNTPARIGHWEPNLYEADFYFMRSTLEKYPEGALVWDASVICGCRTWGDMGGLE